MDRDIIIEKLRPFIASHLNAPVEKVTLDANFGLDLHADSLDAIEIAMEAELMFDIEISDAAAEETRTFGALIDLVEARLKEAPRG